MKRLFNSKETVSEIIRRGLLQGRNTVQIYLMVKDRYPAYDEHKLRKLISTVRGRYIKK